MSDNDIPDPDDQADNLADLREAAARGKTATAEAEAARRELAFVKAKIDTDKGPGKLLFESYKGDPTVDAVLAAADGYGITPTSDTPAAVETPEVVITDDERAQSRERAQLATGAEVPAGTPDPDPYTAGYADYHEMRATGVPQADAADAVLGRVLEAAYLKHDPRVIHNQAAYEAANRGSSRP